MAGSLGLVALSRGLLGAFLEHTSQESRFWRYVSDSSCWVYRIHMPLAGLVPAALMGLPLPLFLKYPLAVALVGAVSWLSCDLLVRNTALGVLLNGRRSPPARPGLRAGGLLLLLFLGGLSLSRSTGSSSQSAWAQGLPAEELLPGTVTLAAEDLAAASG